MEKQTKFKIGDKVRVNCEYVGTDKDFGYYGRRGYIIDAHENMAFIRVDLGDGITPLFYDNELDKVSL